VIASPESKERVQDEDVLAVAGVSKQFGNVRALDRCDLHVRSGEVHGLVGANGAGKSTLVSIISGAIKPDSGVIRIGDWEGGGLEPRLAQSLGIATIYQTPDLVPPFGVPENIALGREPKRLGALLDRKAERHLAERVTRQVGLGERLHSIPVQDMSRSEQALVEIAKALNRSARLIMMDEPTASLGPEDARRLQEVIDGLTQDGIAVLYVSHRLTELMRICDRVSVMRDGRKVLTARSADLTEEQLVNAMTGGSFSSLSGRRRDELPSRELLRVEGLGFGTQLRDVSLTVHRGEVVSLAGLVGAGRSRLLRTLIGLEPSDRGRMFLDGNPYAPGSPGAALRRGVGLVPEDRQKDGLLMTLSVADNIMVTAPEGSVFGVMSRRSERRAALEWIKRLAIVPADPQRTVNTLSGGNQQKVLLARWLHAHVQVLLIDEPTHGVDVGTRRDLIEIIRESAAQGAAVLTASSEPEELFALSDRILVMREGGVVAERRPQETSEDEILALSSGARGLSDSA
jgi:ribose transport system ATP-binding protein